MSALARAYKIEEIEEDPSLTEEATKECSGCDPDNPKGVARAACKTCGGSGRQPIAVSEIAKELKASKKKPTSSRQGNGNEASIGRGAKKNSRNDDDGEDLYLEY